jgi:hypothetical protein
VLKVQIRMRSSTNLTSITELQEYIADSLEKYSSIFVASVSIEIEEWG